MVTRVTSVPSWVIDRAVDSACADVGKPRMSLDKIDADLAFHRKKVLALGSELRDSRLLPSLFAQKNAEFHIHREAISRLETERSKFLFTWMHKK